MRFLPFLTAALAGLLATSAGQLVQTMNGKVQGSSSSVAGRQINQFLGIPYAQPPVGPLRFKRTQPVQNWSGTKAATSWAAQCYQWADNPLNLMAAPYVTNTTYSEDCLYLNIWAPQDCERKPVMIFIHGGALVSGTASLDVYNGEMLASKADAVIVTLNYRVGMLGFMYADGDQANYPGNQGLYDQLQAMKWVKANIAKFGGDPSQVTIVGESAGSWSVSAHIISPLSRPYFKQAIMQSGSGVSEWAVSQPKKYVPTVLAAANIFGCGINKTVIDASVMACINGLGAANIDTLFLLFPRNPINLLFPLIVSPSEFLPKTYKQAFDSKDFKNPLNLLISTVEDEGPLFTILLGGGTRYAYANPSAITRDLAIADAKQWAQVNTGSDQGTFIPNTYFPASLTAQDDLRKRVAEMAGDEALACPTMAFGERVNAGSIFSRVYQLHFASKSGFNKLWCTPWAAPCHGDDLFPTFGYALRHPTSPVAATARETQIANEYMNIFKNFLEKGRPTQNIPLLSLWRPYSRLLKPYYEITDAQPSLASYGCDLKQDKCNVWDQYNSLA